MKQKKENQREKEEIKMPSNEERRENLEKTLKRWKEQNKKNSFEYIFNETVRKIKTVQMSQEIEDELRILTKDIYNAGLSAGIREGMLD